MLISLSSLCLTPLCSGHGGFVEVSGAGVVRYDGECDVRALGKGNTGELFLDPYDVWVIGVDEHDSYLPTIAPGDGGASETFLLTASKILNELKTGQSLRVCSACSVPTPVSASHLSTE